ncbi:MAG: OmpH family outer membrane protein [Proteobacteria bacterium]|nr:OmpH family outer membrane protein [Pseudomonadota bacterium]MBU1713829.1 OmpH family outer membrane protein [Pseudomonadota bacterium]
MRLVKTAVSASIVLFFLLGISAHAADVAKIGVVDFLKILETSNAGKAGQAEIKKQADKMKADLEKKGAEIEELKKKIEKDVMVGNKEMREEKEREAQIKYMDFKNLEKKYSSELQKIQTDSIVRIQKEVNTIADEIGKKEGYLLIIEKREAGVFYAPASVDITEKLIQQYNAKAAPKAGK